MIMRGLLMKQKEDGTNIQDSKEAHEDCKCLEDCSYCCKDREKAEAKIDERKYNFNEGGRIK